jgi:CRP-like cAMP-binding protein
MVSKYEDAGLAQFSRPKTKTLTVSEERKDRLAGLMNYLEDRGEESVEEEQTLVERLMPYLKKEDVPANEVIIKKGKRLRGLYFIEGGSVRVEIEGMDGKPVRLRKMQAGSVVGEVSLYGKKETTADVIAEEECEVYFLAKTKIKKIEEEDIALANDLHKFLTELLGYRTASSTDTIRTLLD